MPHDPRTVHTTMEDDLRPGDDHVVTDEPRSGLGLLVAALVIAAALVFGVWWLAAAGSEEGDPQAPGVPENPPVDIGVDPGTGN